HVSGVPVVAGEQVVGMVTATDLMALAAALPGIPAEHDASDAFERGDVSLDVELGDLAPAAYFADMWEDAGAEVVERFAQPEGPEWNILEERTVGEAMTHAPLASLPSSARVDEAADLMGRLGIHRVLVVDDERLVGIVTSMDIMRAVADRRVVREVYVFGRKYQAMLA
ncbi:MAG TPA: CBS domain-containing protein, partial [Gemmatimonadaceae bacterium]|nr:CBS domain-containing protein [Gemmatimonadaceae bacterium]